jgi:hypothetical protein
MTDQDLIVCLQSLLCRSLSKSHNFLFWIHKHLLFKQQLILVASTLQAPYSCLTLWGWPDSLAQAGCCVQQRLGRGTMVAVRQWWPPCWGCVFFLPSFHLANHVSNVRQLQNQPKTNSCPTKYLHQFLPYGEVWSTHPLHMHRRKMHAPYYLVILPSWGWRL